MKINKIVIETVSLFPFFFETRLDLYYYILCDYIKIICYVISVENEK